MDFLSPMAGLIAAGVAVPALLALYFLKLRRRQVTVSSTLLWKKAVHDLQVNAPFQKLRKNLLLLLQLVILIGLLLAFARPTFKASGRTGRRLAIVIDQSASMNAVDVAPNRLEHARKTAIQLLESFEGSGGAMVVAFGLQARVVQPFTTDKSLLRSAVQSVAATDHASNLQAALALIEPYTAGSSKDDAKASDLTVYVLSDGRFQEGPRMAMHAGALKFVPIGKASNNTNTPDNLAIVSVAARRDFSKPQKTQIFVRLANFGPQPVKTNLSLSVDGRVRKVTAVEVPPAAQSNPDQNNPAAAQPGVITPTPSSEAANADFPPPGSQSVQFDLTLNSSAFIGAAHDHADDLAVDNAAWLNMAPPHPLRVLLVTEGNAFLERVIDSIGVRKLVLMTPKRFEDQDPAQLRRDGWSASDKDEGFDVIFFDHYSPKTTPGVDSVYFGAVPPIAGLERKPSSASESKAQVFLSWERRHPLLRYVALDDVWLLEPGRLALPDNAVVLATGPSGPVMAELASDGVRHVCLSFELLKSNWPMQVSFAVFMSNCVQSLGLGASGGTGVSYRVGEVAEIPVDTKGKPLTYDGPASLQAIADGQDAAVLPMFDRAGVYQSKGKINPPWDKLAVNMIDPVESDLRPAGNLQVSTAAGVETANAQAVVRQEVWPWFVWGALAFLLLEWVIYTRRMHL